MKVLLIPEAKAWIVPENRIICGACKAKDLRKNMLILKDRLKFA